MFNSRVVLSSSVVGGFSDASLAKLRKNEIFSLTESVGKCFPTIGLGQHFSTAETSPISSTKKVSNGTKNLLLILKNNKNYVKLIKSFTIEPS